MATVDKLKDEYAARVEAYRARLAELSKDASPATIAVSRRRLLLVLRLRRTSRITEDVRKLLRENI